ncbi:Ethanolamine utilization protein EutN/carboxysome structural protein Ccml [Moorella glycerini]|uniref:Ethanolamine utilization protein EutN n=1 Tax=Neomoorella stamsii TaxID=1266720 RepID=A0A9X7P611_9FIRM|nr:MULTISPECIES: EutN/CcmL family microcompartment protein [Moorella]PRR72608.1 Ethanolamine utilization protein EutN [Moorella stamsii]CEP67764.1 Ethanolamine utilization protein EutN/carboxysome structural protein Ccml [Moorella glycerini]
MLIGKVIGSVVSTRKHEGLVGLKLLIIRPLNSRSRHQDLVAVDNIGAGTGETVLVTTGSSARLVLNNPQAPVDAAVVGIVDNPAGVSSG